MKENPQIDRRRLYLVDVVGGDRAKTARKAKGNLVCVMISRHGSEEKKAEFAARGGKSKGLFCGMEVADLAIAVGASEVMLDGNDIFIEPGPGAVEDISSTMVRKAFESENRASREELVRRKILHPLVFEYLSEHYDELFEGK